MDQHVMPGCLDGVRVLELSRYESGPRCGMLLSDLGAEVIRIEPLEGDETRKSQPMFKGQSIYFSVHNRGKKSVCIDLWQDAGKKIFFDLLKTADMLAENFPPGTIEKMGLGYEELIKVKPNVVLIRVSGFGQYGPYRNLPSDDTMAQAMSGLMMMTGAQVNGQPIGAAFSIMNRLTALHATIGALAALRHRDRTGEGQIIDVCIMDAAVTTVEIPVAYYLLSGKEDGEPTRQPYVAKDGWLVVSSGTSPSLDQRLQKIIGQQYTGDRQPDRESFFGTQLPALVDWCKERTVAEVYEKLLAIGVPVAPVQSIPQVVRDTHVWEREMLVKMKDAYAGEIYVPGLAIKFSRTPGKLGPVPTPGQHTEEILSKLLDYDAAQIAQLRAQQVI